MEEIWKIAITIGGLGAIGAFVFLSLYKDWLKLQIFSKLTKKQTYNLMRIFLFLVFISLIAFLIAYFKVESINGKKPSKIELVDYQITYSDSLSVEYRITYPDSLDALFPQIDLKLRNTGDEVAFIKEINFKIIDSATYEDCRNPQYSLIKVSATYKVDLINNPIIKLSHAIKPNEVDRIKFIIGRNTGGPTLTVYKTKFDLIYDEDNKVVTSKPFFLKMVGPTMALGLTTNVSSKIE